MKRHNIDMSNWINLLQYLFQIHELLTCYFVVSRLTINNVLGGCLFTLKFVY